MLSYLVDRKNASDTGCIRDSSFSGFSEELGGVRGSMEDNNDALLRTPETQLEIWDQCPSHTLPFHSPPHTPEAEEINAFH